MENKNLINKTLAIVVLFIGIIATNTIYAQTTYKTTNGKTYVFDNTKKVIFNRAQNNKTTQFYATEGFSVNNPSIVSTTFKNILSVKRIRDLKKDKVAVIFECSGEGKIESVKFLFNKTPFLTAQEVEQLEKSFLTQSFSISSNLDKNQCIKFTIPCFFSRIQK